MSQPETPFPSLAPSLLVSMPQLSDPNFHRSVILLCEHGEGGAFGLVLNQRTTTPASEVVRLTPPVSSGSSLRLAPAHSRVAAGRSVCRRIISEPR